MNIIDFLGGYDCESGDSKYSMRVEIGDKVALIEISKHTFAQLTNLVSGGSIREVPEYQDRNIATSHAHEEVKNYDVVDSREAGMFSEEYKESWADKVQDGNTEYKDPDGVPTI